jgi:hypothetical protein
LRANNSSRFSILETKALGHAWLSTNSSTRFPKSILAPSPVGSGH